MNRAWIAVPLAVVAALALAGCQLSAATSGYASGSGPNGGTLVGHTLTNGQDGDSVGPYDWFGSGTTIWATADGGVASNEREAVWFDNEPSAQDEEGCATWDDMPGGTQDGIMLHLTQDSNGIVHSIAVVDNIYFGAFWLVNVYGVNGQDSNTTDNGWFDVIQDGFDESQVFGGLSSGQAAPYAPHPWHMCAETVGATVQFVVWTGNNPKPAYGAPVGSGSVAIPEAYQGPGVVGWWLGHMPANSQHTVSDLSYADNT